MNFVILYMVFNFLLIRPSFLDAMNTAEITVEDLKCYEDIDDVPQAIIDEDAIGIQGCETEEEIESAIRERRRRILFHVYSYPYPIYSLNGIRGSRNSLFFKVDGNS